MNIKLLIALFAAAAMATTALGCEEKKEDDKKAEADGDKDKKDDKDEKKEDGDTKEAKDEGGDGDLSDLPQACQDYIKATEECLSKVDDAAKPAMEQGLKAQRDAFKAANTKEAKEALSTGCEASLKAMKDNPACK